MLATLLRKAGHTVEEAASGSAGLARFRENPADIVLTDFVMPGLTGWDVARAVKTINPRVPVVYVTGAAHEIAPHERAAVDAIIEKPCRLTTVHTVLRRLTGKSGGDQPNLVPTCWRLRAPNPRTTHRGAAHLDRVADTDTKVLRNRYPHRSLANGGSCCFRSTRQSRGVPDKRSRACGFTVRVLGRESTAVERNSADGRVGAESTGPAGDAGSYAEGPVIRTRHASGAEGGQLQQGNHQRPADARR